VYPCGLSCGDTGGIAAEEVQLLRLVKAFTKIKDPQTRREIIEFAEAALEFEEASSQAREAVK
jgi:hypothetical protein